MNKSLLRERVGRDVTRFVATREEFRPTRVMGVRDDNDGGGVRKEAIMRIIIYI